MKLITIKCPECGASLNVDKKSNKTKCEYCGNMIMLDDNTYTIKHMKTGDITEEQEFINAETNLNKLKDYEEAYKGYKELSKRYVDDPLIWLGLVRSLTDDFTYKYGSISYINEVNKYWNNFLSTANKEQISEYKDKYQSYIEKIEATDKSKQNIKEEKNYILVILFFGWFGIHKFMQKNILMGILYLFTGGLFGIGVIVDLIKEIKKWPNSTQLKIAKCLGALLPIILGLTELKYSIIASILYLIAALVILDGVLDKKIIIKNGLIKTIIVIILVITATELSSEVIPVQYYGIYENQEEEIKQIIIDEKSYIVTQDNKKYESSLSVYYEEYIYLDVDGIKYKFLPKKSTICLLDKQDNCEVEYKKNHKKVYS